MMERSEGVDISPHCQRCGSTNTKFCYYNNYSLTQPRYFCKGCRRYWTKGGSLRNVLVGGGCRKTRRGRTVSMSPYHHRPPSTFNMGSTSLDANCVTGNSPNGSSTGQVVGSSRAPVIDLAAVYANFLKQEPKHELESAEKDPLRDSTFELREVLTGPMPCAASLEYQGKDRSNCSITRQSAEMGDPAARIDNALPFELPPLPNEEGSLFFHAADWFGSQLVGSDEPPSINVLPDEFNQENHAINQLVTSWSPFDFPI